MAVRFQDQLGEALRDFQAGQFTYKPPDGVPQNWNPADWLLCRNGKFIAVEAKQTRQNGWPLTDWTPQQRTAARVIEQSGGRYWLVINWRGAAGVKSGDTKTVAVPGFVALNIEPVIERKSLTFRDAIDLFPCVEVPWVAGRGWNVDFLRIGLPQVI